jgi:two-component sensor histidine kinase
MVAPVNAGDRSPDISIGLAFAQLPVQPILRSNPTFDPALLLGLAAGFAMTLAALQLRRWTQRGAAEIDPLPEQSRFLAADIEQYRARLIAAESNREAALREVHHRIKNNLQIVSSLFHLQERAAENPAVILALSAARQRVDMLAVTHAALYRHEKLADVSLGELVGDLAAQMARAQDGPGPQLQFELSLSDRIISADQAVPLTLFFAEAVNQLVPGTADTAVATIAVLLAENTGVDCTMSLSSTGTHDISDLTDPASLPFRLMTSVARQLGGAWKLNDAPDRREIGLTWTCDAP